jgi:hypothetical protein
LRLEESKTKVIIEEWILGDGERLLGGGEEL